MRTFVSEKEKSKGKSVANAPSFALAAVLVLCAAFLMCSLLWSVVSFGGSGHTGFAALGYFLYSVYGVTSFLVPLFLLACAISLLFQEAGFPLYFLLLTSIIPFFTAFGGEKLIRALSVAAGSSFLSKVIFFGLLVSTVLAVITEYLLLFQLALYAEKKLGVYKSDSSLKEKGSFEEKPEPGEEPEARLENESIEYAEGEFLTLYAEECAEHESEDALFDVEKENTYEQEEYAEEGAFAYSESFAADSGFEGGRGMEDAFGFDTESGGALFDGESADAAAFDAEKDAIEEAEAEDELSEIEFDPAMFDGYIAGHFSVMDGEEAQEDLPKLLGESGTASAAIPAARRGRRRYHIDCDILNAYPDGEYWVIDEDTHKAAAALKDTLYEFNIQADVTGIRKGPVITMFEILPAPGVKLSRIVGLQDNIALRLAASSVRIVAPIPGKHAVGIEVPNQKRAIVSFRELIEADSPASRKMDIPVMLGKDITGEAQIIDLTATPHLLIAGSTGSGKSVCVNSIILSILYRRAPDEVKLLLIDPKVVELKLYNDIGHLLSPVITEPKKAFQALQYCLCEMERRYAVLDGMGVRNIKEYNKRILERGIAAEKLPYIVVIIDEFADLMATTGKELESTVARLAAMSRAVGIHLVLATQRPSIDVITGLIKANIPSRIAFMVASKMDSRIIIDQVGAEKLLGKGDMLYSSVTDPFPVRIQGAFVSDEEVERVVEQVKSFGEPEYIDDEIFVDDEDDDSLDTSFFGEGEDPLYDKALDIVLSAGKASASYIQRRLKIGYNRAARLVEDMEMRGIVGPANGSKPREVIHVPDRSVSE